MDNVAKNIARGIIESFEVLMLGVGGLLIACGAWLLSYAAGLITAGVLIVAAVIFRGLGADDRR